MKEELLAADVCECCPTAVTRTSSGLLLAFRGHTKDDIRDIAVTRFVSGRWTSPKIVYPDKWQVDACPVNAAAVTAKGDKVAVSWYTAAGNKPRVELSLSADAGATFSKAAVVSTGDAYGYTSIAMDNRWGIRVVAGAGRGWRASAGSPCHGNRSCRACDRRLPREQGRISDIRESCGLGMKPGSRGTRNRRCRRLGWVCENSPVRCVSLSSRIFTATKPRLKRF